MEDCFGFFQLSLSLGRKVLPARLIKNWIILIPDPIPFGLTRLLAITRAMVWESFLKVPSGGYVETVFTRADHFLGSSELLFFAAIDSAPVFTTTSFVKVCRSNANISLGIGIAFVMANGVGGLKIC
jgi:hypothetical protein